MRAKHKYKKREIRFRNKNILYPLNCVVCNKEIVNKQWYYSKRGYEAHKDCVPENLIDNEN